MGIWDWLLGGSSEDPLIPGIPDPFDAPRATLSQDEQDAMDAKKFLAVEVAVLSTIVAAPLIYVAATKPPKGAKAIRQDERIREALHNASNRATSMVSALGPAAALPLAYVTVQKLEDADYITKGLGDAVQTIMLTMAAAPVAGAAIDLATKFVAKGAAKVKA